MQLTIYFYISFQTLEHDVKVTLASLIGRTVQRVWEIHITLLARKHIRICKIKHELGL